MTKVPIQTENKKAKRQQKSHQNNSNYTTTAERLRTVSWTNYSYQTGVVKLVCGHPTFPLTAKDVQSKGNTFKNLQIIILYRPRTNSKPKQRQQRKGRSTRWHSCWGNEGNSGSINGRTSISSLIWEDLEWGGHLIRLKRGVHCKTANEMGPSQCKIYGRIILLSTAGKVVKIILDRTKTAADKLLQDHQAGFRKDSSCPYQIATLRIIVEQ